MTTIPLRTLEEAFALVAQHVRQAAGENVYLEHDYFWSVPADALYDIDRPPAELTLGQLSECRDHIKPLMDEPEDVLGYHLVWLGELLKAIGHKVVG